MKKILFYFAIIGWIISVFVFVFSLLGVDVEDKLPFTWILHIGIFAVWAPTVYYLWRNPELREYRFSLSNIIDFFKIIFKQTPLWLIILAAVSFVCPLFVVFSPLFDFYGIAGVVDGQYVLHNHGIIIKTLTEQEYHSYFAREFAGFSGMWMAFYGVASALLYPWSKRPNKNNIGD